METTNIKLALIEQNNGQIPGLPTNPRQWTGEELKSLVASIKETPELLEARGLLVYPNGNRYVIIGGNMRYHALKEMGRDEAPCIVLPADTSIDKLKELVIKDNGSWGKWDWDELANNWDDCSLSDWGVSVWEQPASEEGQSAGSGEHTKAKEDEFDEQKDTIKVLCKKGDIWQLGEHRLMCGDSIDLESVKRLMGGRELTWYSLTLRMA